MSTIPPYNSLNQKMQNQKQPKIPKVKYRFRWSIIVVPGVIMGFIWLLNSIEPSIKFEDVMDMIKVDNTHRYIRLACLGVVGTLIVLIMRILRAEKKG